MPIQKLAPLLVNQIAAGEVIERPASVVKELIENSLDAGATRIDIAIQDGGRTLIRVADNGAGIAPNELPLAVAAHATSKLSNAHELASIKTLGFRGEALASIASVSRLRVTSRATLHNQPAESGAAIEVEGGYATPPAPAACSPGTIVEIRDLFFNTPARRKFTRAASTEFGHISEIITRTAMVRPDVGIKLAHGSRTVMDLPEGQSRRRRCLGLLGQELDELLLEFQSKDNASQPSIQSLGSSTANPPKPTVAAASVARVWGLAGMPSIARSTSKFQYLSVNGRPIRDRTLSHAVKEAYRGLLPPDKHPMAVVMIDIPPEMVDVNVHPTKAEVRFLESNRVHGLILTAIRQRLLGSDLTPTAGLTRDAPSESLESQAQQVAESSPTQSPARSPLPRVVSPSLSTDAFVDYFKQMQPRQRGFVYEQVKQAMGDDLPQPLFDSAADAAKSDSTASSSTVAPQTMPSPKVLQIHDSYLVTQDEHGLLIIDQHALHERVMFEQLSQRVASRDMESQRLLTAGLVKASPSQCAKLESLQPLLSRIGIDAQPIGPNMVAIHAFPSFLFERHVDPEQFVEELLDRAEAGDLILPDSPKTTSDTPDTPQSPGEDNPPPGTIPALNQERSVEEAVLHKVLDMMACKAAVKAGDHMTLPELEALLEQRQQIERSSNCPHGRPTSHRITLKDLEKRFQRT